MLSLISERFLKQFIGSRLHQRRVNPDSEGMTLPADETGKPDEAGYTTGGNPLDKDATLEKEQTGAVNQLTVPGNGSCKPAADDHPLTVDVRQDYGGE